MTTSSVKVALDTAAEAIKRGNVTEGKEGLNRVLELEPNNVLALLWMTRCEDALGDKKRLFERVLQIDPTNEHAIKGLGMLAISNGHSDDNSRRKNIYYMVGVVALLLIISAAAIVILGVKYMESRLAGIPDQSYLLTNAVEQTATFERSIAIAIESTEAAKGSGKAILIDSTSTQSPPTSAPTDIPYPLAEVMVAGNSLNSHLRLTTSEGYPWSGPGEDVSYLFRVFAVQKEVLELEARQWETPDSIVRVILMRYDRELPEDAGAISVNLPWNKDCPAETGKTYSDMTYACYVSTESEGSNFTLYGYDIRGAAGHGTVLVLAQWIVVLAVPLDVAYLDGLHGLVADQIAMLEMSGY